MGNELYSPCGPAFMSPAGYNTAVFVKGTQFESTSESVTPAPPSLGFSRQEHWSGLPFPSPMHESEK